MWQLMGAQDASAEPDQKDPNQASYLTRFGAPLPAISPQNSPQPSVENQMIPYSGRRAQLSQIEQPPMVGDPTDGRLRHVEGRLAMMEQSNRALLEEVVRLQGELKSSHRRTEEALQGERQSRQQLTENIRGSNDLIGTLGARLKRAEEKMADERSAVSALVNHTKQVEQAVLGGQQELVSKKDQQMAKIAELRNDVDEANRLREHLERATTTVVDELRQLKGKVDTASIEVGGTLHDVKERTKRLEEEQRQAKMEHNHKSQDVQHSSEQAATLLRTQLDARLGEVRDVMMDLRNRLTAEESERRQQDQNTQVRLTELQGHIHEQRRKQDESVHSLDMVQREREHAADGERLKMQSKISEIAEEVSRKMLSKEIKLREEAQQKFTNVEKYLHAEQAARMAHEQTLREENEKRWEALQKLTEEEVINVREGQKLDRHKNVGTMGKVVEMMDKLDRQQQDTRKQLEVVMKAEIKSRQSQDKQIENKIDDVQEKLGIAISSLQQAIGGINEQMVVSNNEYQDKMKSVMAENNQGSIRGMADLDARLVSLQTRLAAHEESTEEKIQEVRKTADDDSELQELKQSLESTKERLDELIDWKDSADKKQKGMRERMDELGPEIREISQSNDSIRTDMKSMIDNEAKDRVRDVQMVKLEFDGKFKQLQAEKNAEPAPTAVPALPVSQKEKLAQGKGAKLDDATRAQIDGLQEQSDKTKKNLDEMKEELGQMDSSIQTLRVHLTRKIEGEAKSRRKDLQDTQDVFEDLKYNLAPLLDQAAAIEEAMKKLDKKQSKESAKDDPESEEKKDKKSPPEGDNKKKESSSKDRKGGESSKGGKEDRSASKGRGVGKDDPDNANNSNSNKERGRSKERGGGKDDKQKSDADKEKRRKERDEKKRKEQPKK